MTDHRKEVVRRIKDENKLLWGLEDASIPDKDAFFTECVLPLRQLRDEGILGQIEEIPIAVDGNVYPGIVDIIGPINLDG
jgi:hypothetical protein